jgi:hypothetical protein
MQQIEAAAEGTNRFLAPHREAKRRGDARASSPDAALDAPRGPAYTSPMRNLIILAALALFVACAHHSEECERAADAYCAHLNPQDRPLCHSRQVAKCHDGSSQQ